ncbi:MAG: hypothetical protein M3016_05755 [Actinomycetota bacterium]|nr:hypothetical protein [Actinomycetota bacterium]
MKRRAAALALPAVLLATPSATAVADSFSPVTMSVSVIPIARLRAPLRVKVSVKADPGVLDTSEGQLRVQVKLAVECGGSYQTTPGVSLVNAPLKPQPTVGKPYSGGARGAGRPTAYGTRTVCAFLEDPASDRVYANDQSLSVSVTRACTVAGRRYDAARRALHRAQRQLRRAHAGAPRRQARRLVA